MSEHQTAYSTYPAVTVESNAPDPAAAVREALAALAHEQWAGWMVYLFGRCRVFTDEGALIISAQDVARWGRQIRTPYADLPENEKESDRAEADRVLALLDGMG